MLALCQSFGAMRVAAPRATAAPQAAKLSSRANGIAAAPRLVAARLPTAPLPAAALAVDVQCADGRRGGKLKTRKSAAKRYKITGSGRVLVRHAGKNHFQEKKNSKRRQRLSVMHLASETHLDLIKGCLPYAKLK